MSETQVEHSAGTHSSPVMRDMTRGVIAHVSGNDVVVVYDRDGDLIEHTYERRRMIGEVAENDTVELESILRVIR